MLVGGVLPEGVSSARMGSGGATAAPVQDFAEAQDFELGERVYHADDQAVAQYYLALSTKFNLPAARKPTMERFDTVIANPSDVDLDHSVKGAPADYWRPPPLQRISASAAALQSAAPPVLTPAAWFASHRRPSRAPGRSHQQQLLWVIRASSRR